jgi:hypothetical protein
MIAASAASKGRVIELAAESILRNVCNLTPLGGASREIEMGVNQILP